MFNRVVFAAIRGAVIGFFVVFLTGTAVVMTIAMIADIAGSHSFSFSVGPILLMSSWSGSEGSGIAGGWVLGALSYVGAIVGAVVGVRRERAGGAKVPSGR